MLENLEPTTRELACKVRTIMTQLDKNDADLFTAYLADDVKWPSNSLSKALKSRGLEISPNTLQKHRMGNCSC
jgi:hypothetical protein